MRRLGWVVGLVALSTAVPALAEEPECQRVGRGSQTEIVCREMHIEGDASPRPYVLLGRGRDTHAPRALDRELAPEIPRTVRRAPF